MIDLIHSPDSESVIVRPQRTRFVMGIIKK
jgi:hypothetical protein